MIFKSETSTTLLTLLIELWNLLHSRLAGTHIITQVIELRLTSLLRSNRVVFAPCTVHSPEISNNPRYRSNENPISSSEIPIKVARSTSGTISFGFFHCRSALFCRCIRFCEHEIVSFNQLYSFSIRFYKTFFAFILHQFKFQ